MLAAWTPRGSRLPALLVAALLTTASAVALPPDAAIRPDYQPAAFAIVGAKVETGHGPAIEAGTVVVRDGVIEAVGPADQVEVPFDAERIDAKGMVVYPGFIDLYTNLGVPTNASRSQTGPARPVPYSDFAYPRTPPDNRNGLTPEFEVAKVLDLPDATIEERQRLGFTDLLAAPAGAIASGQSALVSLSGLPRREAIVKTPVALHIAPRPLSSRPTDDECEYCALGLDEHEAWTADEPSPATPAPATPTPMPTPSENPAQQRRRVSSIPTNYPMSLMGVVAHLRQAMLDAQYLHEAQAYYEKKGGPRPAFDPALEALYEARTGKLPVWWEANTRDEIHRALDLSEEFGTTAVIVGGREAAKVADRLKAKGVPVVLRLDFPEEPKVPSQSEYRRREASERNASLRVLQNRAAKWKERVQTASDLAKAGITFAFSSAGITKAETFHAQVRKVIEAGLPADAAVAALTRDAATIAGLGHRLGTIEKGKLGHLVVMTAPYGEEKAKARYILVDGRKFDLERSSAAARGPRTTGGKEETKSEAPKGKGREDQPKKTGPKGESTTKEEPTPKDPAQVEAAKQKAATQTVAPPKTEEDQPPSTPFADIASELEEDRRPRIKTGGHVLIKDATILTVAQEGTIPKGSILVRNGKIAAIGTDLTAPEGVTVIDATGLVALPGIIDTHSHMAISGGVNEMSLSIVPEVRVRDVVNGSDPTIYRALAGGTTTARLLHGSANTIGGQDVVIKLRYGEAGRDLILNDDRRPQGVKFALGENVTRRNGRFPNTRMGVEATIERAFEEGRAYKALWEDYQARKAKGEDLLPPRRDLRLEALARIVDGSIKIHSHCYRSDEILMLLRVAQRYGIRVQSLQHVLEGYKVAAEIAAHGASASTFSDWWAYKIEAYDAIPFNAALLTEAGARVCIKSDSEELVRHLNLEAAKMMKYGGVPEAKALEMITLNPARELGLEHRLGSIEVGKDADIVLFNAHPFDSYARCQLALIDGEVRFQRKEKDDTFAPRPGDHSVPQAEAEARARVVTIAPNPKGAYALVGATLHPISGPEIRNGTLVVADGKIAAMGGPETAIPTGVPTIDLKGLDIWPGMVDAGDVVGLFEVGSLSETQDFADSATIQPELRTSTALHPDSELIPVTRANGVLAAYVQPSGGTISGQGCLVQLDGWVPSEMVLVDRIALNVNIPPYYPIEGDALRPRAFGGAGGDPNARRRERLDAIKDEFRKALAYDRVMAEARARRSALPPVPDPRLAALVPYAKGEKPVLLRADRRVEILDALKLAEELKLKAIITGGLEAWKVADALKAAQVPVLVAGTLRLPAEATDPYDAAYANPARLYEAGVRFAIRSLGQGPNQATAIRNLPYEAATAVAYGLPESEALKAVTLYPAQILGVADQLGSLEVGKRANLVVTAGPLLQASTEVKALFIGGKPLAPESRHTRLYGKYRQRLLEVKAGTAPLGLERDSSLATSPPTADPPVAQPADQK